MKTKIWVVKWRQGSNVWIDGSFCEECPRMFSGGRSGFRIGRRLDFSSNCEKMFGGLPMDKPLRFELTVKKIT